MDAIFGTYRCHGLSDPRLDRYVVKVLLLLLILPRLLSGPFILKYLNLHKTADLRSIRAQPLTADGIAYPLVVYFVKLSILLLYFRIFGIDRKLRVIIHITIAIITLFYAIMASVSIAGVVKCSDYSQHLTYFCRMLAGPIIATTATFNFISDVWILSLPFPLIFQLHLRFLDKVGLAVVFATGLA